VEQLFTIPPQVIYRPTKDGGMRPVLMPATRIGLQLEPPDDEEEA